MNEKLHLKSYIALNRNNLYQWCLQKWSNNNNINNNNGEIDDLVKNSSSSLDMSQLASQSFLGEPYEWSVTTESLHSSDWWAVKASRGNGGKDVWIIHRDNFQEIIPTLPQSEEYVIQR